MIKQKSHNLNKQFPKIGINVVYIFWDLKCQSSILHTVQCYKIRKDWDWIYKAVYAVGSLIAEIHYCPMHTLSTTLTEHSIC